MKPSPSLFTDIAACRVCAANLPLGPRPVILASDPRARILIIGQAPGTKVHASGIPWDDASGDNLRSWLGVDRDEFYDMSRFAIMPMGFCYPGKIERMPKSVERFLETHARPKYGSGDAPPRPECAPLWHDRVRAQLPNIQLTLLIGTYAQSHYLKSRIKPTLTETVHAASDYHDDGFFPLVHPSPRNRIWQAKNQWFMSETIPALRAAVSVAFGS